MLFDVFIQTFAGKNAFQTFLSICLLILCLYPVIGALFWFFGSLSYQFLKKGKKEVNFVELPIDKQPMITIMIPAHNEEIMIEETIDYLATELNYSNYELLLINDGSTDNTLTILQDLQNKYKKLRAINVLKNQGKAHGFNIGTHFAKGEYILSNDADTIPERDALMKYMNYFINEVDVNTATVTANMDVQNRTSLLGKSQTVEFSSIVGVIKRSQTAVNDSMYSYSGANTMYKKQFLIDVGGFRQDRSTEDISIAWDHLMFGVTPRFAPNILFHMNVPETLSQLYKQRKRWAQGGTEVWLTNFSKFILHPLKYKYVYSMFLDTTFSIIWSFFFFITSFIFLAMMTFFVLTGDVERLWHGVAMAFIFVTFELISGIFQLLAALILDSEGEKLRYLIFAPLYMLLFWMVNPLTIVTTFIPALKAYLGKDNHSGAWVSPTRKSLKKG